MRLLTEDEVLQVSGALNMMVLEPIQAPGTVDIGFYQSAQGTWFLALSNNGGAPFAELNIGVTAICMAVGRGVGVVVSPGSPLASAIIGFAAKNACSWGLQDYYPDTGNDGDGY